MPNKLFIRALSLPQSDGDMLTHFEWALYARAGQKLSGGLAETFQNVVQILDQNAIDDVQIVGLVPANWVHSTRVTIPGKQTRFIQQALPFAVEDQLAEDLDNVHIALGDKNSDGSHSVDIINHHLFETFHTALLETGYPVNALYSDASLLPVTGINVTLAFENDWVLISSDNGAVSRVKLFNAASYFESVFKETEVAENPIQKVNCYISPNQLDSLKLLLAELQQIEGFEWTIHDLNIPILDLLCESWFQQGTKGINLCQGEFKIASGSEPSLKKWRAVAAVAGIWFLLQVGLDLGKGFYYQKEAQINQQQALQLYKSIFPGERRVTVNNLKRSLQGKLKQATSDTGSNDFLSLLSETGYQYSLVPNSQSIEFNSINFSDQRQELTIELKASSFQQLDQLKNGLTSAGLGAKISSAINEQNSVRGRLSVTGS